MIQNNEQSIGSSINSQTNFNDTHAQSKTNPKRMFLLSLYILFVSGLNVYLAYSMYLRQYTKETGIFAILIILYFTLYLALIYLQYKIYVNCIPATKLRQFSQKFMVEQRNNNYLLLTQSSIKTIKICKNCNLYQSSKILHCKKCQNCYLFYDHHCQWLGCCIIGYNYKWFIMFLIVIDSFMLLYTILDAYIFESFIKFQSSLINQNEKFIIFILCILSILQSFIVFIYVLQLLIFHIWLMNKGLSTRQYYSKSNPKQQRFWLKMCHQYEPIIEQIELQIDLTKSESYNSINKKQSIFEQHQRQDDQTEMSIFDQQNKIQENSQERSIVHSKNIRQFTQIGDIIVIEGTCINIKQIHKQQDYG